MRLLLVALALIALGCPSRGPAMRIFAASSLSSATRDLADAFTEETGVPVVLNFAGTQALAQQLRAGASGDVFLSADEAWMRTLVAGRVVDEASTLDFAANQVVLVAHKESGYSIRSVADLPDLTFTKFATGFPDVVPIGRYTKRALDEVVRTDNTTVWQSIERRLVPTADVRQALALAEADPRIIAAVYTTDANTSEAIQTLATLDVAARYFAARLTHAHKPAEAQRFLTFLESDKARRLLKLHGFLTDSVGR